MTLAYIFQHKSNERYPNCKEICEKADIAFYTLTLFEMFTLGRMIEGELCNLAEYGGGCDEDRNAEKHLTETLNKINQFYA